MELKHTLGQAKQMFTIGWLTHLFFATLTVSYSLCPSSSHMMRHPRGGMLIGGDLYRKICHK